MFVFSLYIKKSKSKPAFIIAIAYINAITRTKRRGNITDENINILLYSLVSFIFERMNEELYISFFLYQLAHLLTLANNNFFSSKDILLSAYLVEEDVIGSVVESDASVNRRSVEFRDFVTEIVQSDSKENFILEERVIDAEDWPLKVVDEGIGVREMFRQVAADDGAVGEEVEGDLGPLRLQGLCHVTKARADLNL